MSNNKLYTENQVIKLLDKHTVLVKIGIEFYLNQMKPIELPSDEEINDEWEVGHSDYQNGCNYGAKWMRDKIQGGNNA
jgi:hypothetical protein